MLRLFILHLLIKDSLVVAPNVKLCKVIDKVMSRTLEWIARANWYGCLNRLLRLVILMLQLTITAYSEIWQAASTVVSISSLRIPYICKVIDKVMSRTLEWIARANWYGCLNRLLRLVILMLQLTITAYSEIWQAASTVVSISSLRIPYICEHNSQRG